MDEIVLPNVEESDVVYTPKKDQNHIEGDIDTFLERKIAHLSQRSLNNAIARSAEFSSTYKILKALGIQSSRVANKCWDLLEVRLHTPGYKFSTPELSILGGIASSRARELLGGVVEPLKYSGAKSDDFDDKLKEL